MARGSKFFRSKFSLATEEGSREKSKEGIPKGGKKGKGGLPGPNEFSIGFETLEADEVGVVALLLLVEMLGERPCDGGARNGWFGQEGIVPKFGKRDIDSSFELPGFGLLVLEAEFARKEFVG